MKPVFCSLPYAAALLGISPAALKRQAARGEKPRPFELQRPGRIEFIFDYDEITDFANVQKKDWTP